MPLDLPEQVDASILNKFDFGASEAVKDKLLLECYCDIAPIRTFLQDRTSILVGAKGSGKTAVFTLLKARHLKFKGRKKEDTIVITVDEPIEYATAANVIENALSSTVKDLVVRYQFLWEVYVLYRICLALKDRKDLQSVKGIAEVLCSLFSSEQKRPTLLQLLTSVKATVGFKLNMSNPAFPAPDFYFSAEPAAGGSSGEAPSAIDLEEYKQELNSALEKKGIALYVLVDNLDDFVAKDSYATQRTILHAILNCSRSYSRFPALRVKVSLRSDLFHKMDFSQLGGYDKIAPDTVELVWKDADIRHFIYKRLVVNLIKGLGLKELRAHVDETELYLHPPESKQPALLRRLLKIYYKVIPSRRRPDRSAARIVTVRDEISRQVILSVFPRDVLHRTAGGGKVRHELFSYLATHFDLGDGNTTPRIILLFLQNLVAASSTYYQENPDERRLRLTEKKEFPLFKREHFLSAYASLQRNMLEIFKSCMTLPDWQSRTDSFFAKKGRTTTFGFQALRKTIGLSNEEECKAYLAYLVHLGVLRCRNDHAEHRERTYELPLLLQYIWED